MHIFKKSQLKSTLIKLIQNAYETQGQLFGIHVCLQCYFSKIFIKKKKIIQLHFSTA